MLSCGLDFGTSNSAIGVAAEGPAALVPLENGSPVLPTAIFFDYEQPGRIVFGQSAIRSYMEQHDGRLMRALKSVLGSALIGQRTAVAGRMMSFEQIIELYVGHLKRRAEDFTGDTIDAVVHGRPVRFVDNNDLADADAQSALEGIAKRVGFRHIEFLYEPLAAAYHYETHLTDEALVLVADIGGGTSDFTVVRLGPKRRTRVDRKDDILASQGIRIGGTDFDSALSLAKVMPVLGLGSQLRTKALPAPTDIYFDLANWSTINFAYTPQYDRQIQATLRDAIEPEKLERLQKVVRGRHGHRVAVAVEKAKVGLSGAARARLAFDAVPGLDVELTVSGFDGIIEPLLTRIRRTAAAVIRGAGVLPADITAVFLTGGSSRVPALRALVRDLLPAANLMSGSDLLSVGLGLTEYSARVFGGARHLQGHRA